MPLHKTWDMEHSLDVWIVDPANLTPFYSFALARALVDVGDRVTLVSSPFSYDRSLEVPPGVLFDDGYFPWLRSWQQREGSRRRTVVRALQYPWGHLRTLRRARTHPPHVVHLQWSRVPPCDAWLVRRLKRLTIPVVHTVHDVEPLYQASGGVSALERVYAACDALIVHTRANAAELHERYRSIDPSRVHVIPHGPLQTETIPEGANQAAARTMLGLPLDAPIVLFFGTIKPYKGLDLLLEAFAPVRERIPHAHLLVAGKPPSAADLPPAAAFSRLGNAVTAKFGFIPNRDVWKYYLAADVVALPYRAITQSGVLLSAFAFGRAAVVSRVGGLGEVLEQGDVGWIVGKENLSELTEALIAACHDRAATLAKGANARRLVDTEFAWSSIARQTHALYQNLRKAGGTQATVAS